METTDNEKMQVDIDETKAEAGPLDDDMPDQCIGVEDAIRAAKDRASMEAELADLREECERLRSELEAAEGALAMNARAARHFEAALREIADADTPDEHCHCSGIARSALAKMEGGGG